MASGTPFILHTENLTPKSFKVELLNITYVGRDGKEHPWTTASRKPRGASGVDAVLIPNIIRQPNKPPSMALVIQYRPPTEADCVEWPAGLIEAGETPQDAALREFKEEVGYDRGRVVHTTPTAVADPGMSTANLQFATVEVDVKEGDQPPVQNLQDNEDIVVKYVALDDLYDELVKYAENGLAIDARVLTFAMGWNKHKEYSSAGLC